MPAPALSTQHMAFRIDISALTQPVGIALEHSGGSAGVVKLGETVRVAVTARQYDGTVRDPSTIRSVSLAITASSTDATVLTADDLAFDTAAGHFDATWSPTSPGRYRVTATLTGTDSSVSIEARPLQVVRAAPSVSADAPARFPGNSA
jgi:hypothetical protein